MASPLHCSRGRVSMPGWHSVGESCLCSRASVVDAQMDGPGHPWASGHDGESVAIRHQTANLLTDDCNDLPVRSPRRLVNHKSEYFRWYAGPHLNFGDRRSTGPWPRFPLQVLRLEAMHPSTAV